MKTPRTAAGAREEQELCYRVERFLYREARLLDDRLHLEWLELLAEDFRYEMPLRTTAEPEPDLEGKDAMWDVERELSSPHELGFWNENKLQLAVRVARSRQVQAWADSPPPRTRRIVGNVTLEPGAREGEFAVRSNLLLSCGRQDEPARLFTAERRDRLRPDPAQGFLLVHRRVVPDWTVFPAGSMNLFF